MAMRVTPLPFAVRTTSEASKPVTVWEKFTTGHFVVDHPNVGGGLTVVVYGYDEYSGYKYSLLSTAILTSGHTLMKIGSDYTAGANVAKDYIPYQFIVDVTASGTNAYSVSASIM